MDYGVLARSYNTLLYPNQLKTALGVFLNSNKYDSLSKIELHRTINNLLYKNYDGEEIIKYKLANTFLKKNYIAAFEVKAQSSRADFLVINGNTKCFEIKSKIDTLRRLKKQSKDYSDVFEYNTVVIDKKHLHVENLLPAHYGIWYFNGNKKVIHRAATLSPNINPKAQLSLLTKKELEKFFFSSSFEQILEKYTPKEINNTLKEILKQRYNKRWNFIKDNWNSIFPIDLQFFFNSNICPQLIYSF